MDALQFRMLLCSYNLSDIYSKQKGNKEQYSLLYI